MKYLITGGAGSLGKVLTEKLLSYGSEVVVYDWDENAVAWLKRFGPQTGNLKLVLGDVNDSQKLDYALEGVDVVVHAAYAKHVDLCESDPLFGLKVNIEGTMNVVASALRNDVAKFVFVSSDKAVYPVSVYGKCKSLCESLVLRSSHYRNGGKTLFSVVRPPNYAGSACSVMQIWEEQKRRGEPLTVTHRDMERYFMTFEDMVEFIFACILDMEGGEIFVPVKVEKKRIMDLAHSLSSDIKVIGVREGERLNAHLMTQEEEKKAERADLYWVIKS